MIKWNVSKKCYLPGIKEQRAITQTIYFREASEKIINIMKISSIIVTFNASRWIDKCFGSLLNSSVPLHIIAIDNGSTDGTPDILRNNYPLTEIIETGQNLGFSKANNIGLKIILSKDFDFVFLLNQDAWIEKNTIRKLLDIFINYPDAGIVSPMHLNGNRTGFDYLFSGYLSTKNTPGIIYDLYLNNLKECYKTNFVNAAAWLISTKCIEKVGVFDTSLFCHYGEDDNYCNRVRYHNLSIYLATGTTICHDRENRNNSRSIIFEKQNARLYQKIYYSNPFLDDQVIDNQITLLRKNYINGTLKYFLGLNFIYLQKYRKQMREDLELFRAIRKSRALYQDNPCKWLI